MRQPALAVRAAPAGGEDIIILDEDQTYDGTTAKSQSSEQVDVDDKARPANSPTPAPNKDGTPQLPDIDPQMKAFMKRAMQAIGAGTAMPSSTPAVPTTRIGVGDVFDAKVAVPVMTDIKDEEGNVVDTTKVWYGGNAMVKVIAKRSDGTLEVIRSVMPAYNRWGRLEGRMVAAAYMTIGDTGERIKTH